MRAIIKAPRGGGKSQIIATLGFCLWYLYDRQCIDMGGSLEQAKEVYKYFISYVENEQIDIISGLPKDPTLQLTYNAHKKYFKCVTASPKQVRGPHPDVLLGDEVCETDDEIIRSALPMVSTSEHPLVVLTSTFHKIFGIFQEIWDSAPQLGYKRYSWDIFDVVRTFDPAIWNDENYKREIPDFDKLRQLSKDTQGKYRFGDPEGWIPIQNVIQAWREKPTLDWFLVEYMGSRPSASGLVLDPIHVDRAFVDFSKQTSYNFIKGTETIGGIDWGFSSMTAMAVGMKHKDDVKAIQEIKTYSHVKSSIIIEDAVAATVKYKISMWYCDSEAKFENEDLRHALAEYVDPSTGEQGLQCDVVEVVFGKEKDFMVGNLRAHFEQDKMKIDVKQIIAKWQLKRYRYQENTNKPIKKDDHIPDAIMCMLQHWPLNRKPERLQDFMKSIVDEHPDMRPITAGLMDEQF